MEVLPYRDGKYRSYFTFRHDRSEGSYQGKVSSGGGDLGYLTDHRANNMPDVVSGHLFQLGHHELLG